MRFDDSEKPGRHAALKNLMSMIGGETSKKLHGLKKPALAIDVEGSPDEEAHESPDDEAAEGEPSEEDKAKITELYMKYCK